MNWELKQLDEIGYISRGKSRHRPRNDKSLYGGIYPFIQTGDIQKANLYINDFENAYNEMGLSQSKLWKAGTLCISIVGANTAATAILGIDACFPDSVIGFNGYDGKSVTKFVKYFLDTKRIELHRISLGTARENLSMEKLLTMKIPVPPFETQQKIASILSAYDDLIENNLKRIRLLEEAAQHLYREWFLQFRFPDWEEVEVVDGLPEGWERKNLNTVFSIKYGKNLSTDKITEVGKYPVYGASGKMGYFENCNLNMKTALVTSRGNGSGDVHRTFENETFVTNNSFTVTPNAGFEHIPFFYVIELLKSLNLKSYCSGSAQPQLTNSALTQIEFSLPTQNLIKLYSEKCTSFFDLTDLLLTQNQKLKEARDILLPRLMNQTIEV